MYVERKATETELLWNKDDPNPIWYAIRNLTLPGHNPTLNLAIIMTFNVPLGLIVALL